MDDETRALLVEFARWLREGVKDSRDRLVAALCGWDDDQGRFRDLWGADPAAVVDIFIEETSD